MHHEHPIGLVQAAESLEKITRQCWTPQLVLDRLITLLSEGREGLHLDTIPIFLRPNWPLYDPFMGVEKSFQHALTGEVVEAAEFLRELALFNDHSIAEAVPKGLRVGPDRLRSRYPIAASQLRLTVTHLNILANLPESEPISNFHALVESLAAGEHSELRETLNVNGGITKETDLVSAPTPAKSVPQQRKEKIICLLKSWDIDPLALPPHVLGSKGGVKARARKTFDWVGKRFDKAWEGLRQDGEIRDALPQIGADGDIAGE